MRSELTANRRKPFLSLLTGGAIVILGGLIGLGGAEFRLPILLITFGYTTLPAVVVNLVVSLVTVVFFLNLSARDYTFRPHRVQPLGGREYSGGLAYRFLFRRPACGAYQRARAKTHGCGLVSQVELAVNESRVVGHSGTNQLNPLLKVVLGFLAGIAISGVSSLLGSQAGN